MKGAVPLERMLKADRQAGTREPRGDVPDRSAATRTR